MSRLALEPTQPPIQWVPGVPTPGIKLPGRECDNSPPSRANVKSALGWYEGVSKSFRTESITKYMLATINTRWEATQRVMTAKLTRLTHKIAIEVHLVAESCIVRSFRSRWPVRKLLVTPSYTAIRQSWRHLVLTLFNHANYVPSNGKMICQLWILWYEVVVAYFKVQSQHLFRGTEENSGTPQNG